MPAGTLRALTQPELTAGELLLRPWRTGDVPDLVRAYADPAIQRWNLRTMTEAEAHDWVVARAARWADEVGVDWAVVAGGGLVGWVGLRTLDLHDGAGEVAYWVLLAARGRGVAARALTAMTDWLFGEVGLHRLELAHASANEASCRVADRAGYPLEGVRRSEALHADGWHDMHLHARLHDDPPPLAARPP